MAAQSIPRVGFNLANPDGTDRTSAAVGYVATAEWGRTDSNSHLLLWRQASYHWTTSPVTAGE